MTKSPADAAAEKAEAMHRQWMAAQEIRDRWNLPNGAFNDIIETIRDEYQAAMQHVYAEAERLPHYYLELGPIGGPIEVRALWLAEDIKRICGVEDKP